MNKIILEVYFAHQLADNVVVHSWLEIFGETSTYIFIIFIIVLILFAIVFLIPLLFRNPKSYYKKYLYLREEMHKIDEFYNNKKISFEEYTFALFNYAKEYDIVVSYLSKFPEFKANLKSYTLKEKHNSVSPKTTEDKTVIFLFNLLRPHAKYYSADEVKQALLEEGFSISVSSQVVQKLIDVDVPFASERKIEQNKVINIINSLLAKDYDGYPEVGKASTIELNDLTKKKQSVFGEENVTFEKYPSIKKTEAKKSSFSFKGMFKKEPQVRTVNEINDIFAEIERKLKEEK